MPKNSTNKLTAKNLSCISNNEQILIDRKSTKKLFPILSEYSFFDLCRAIFCINSWRYNRPNLSLCLTLNYVLSKIDRAGTKHIQNYTQFCSFYEKVKKCNNSSLNDPIIPDFGEIKIAFNGSFYPVLIGNGYNHSYPLMKCLDTNISTINKEGEMEDVLSYVLEMVDALQNIEPFDSDKYQYDELSCPSEKYFYACLDYYKRISPLDDCFIRMLSFQEQKDITTSHFLIEHGKVLLPLFNSSIIIDAYNTIMLNIPNLETKRNQIADRAVYSRLCSNFDISPKSPNILFSVGVVENLEKQKILEQILFDFALINQKSLILFMNESALQDRNMTRLYNAIKELHSKNNLKIIQLIKDEKPVLFDFSKMETVEIIFYDNNIQLGYTIKFKESDKMSSCYLYDLIEIFDLSHNGEEIVEFFSKFYNGNLKSTEFYSGLSGLFSMWLESNKEFSQGAYEFSNVLYGVYDFEWSLFEKFLDLNEWYPFNNYSEMFEDPFRWIVRDEADRQYKLIGNKAAMGFGGYFRKIRDSYLLLAYNFNFEADIQQWNIRTEHIRMLEELLERNMLLIEDALIKANVYAFDGVQITYLPLDYARTVDNTHVLDQDKKYVYSDCSLFQNKLLIRFAVNDETLMNDIMASSTKNVECEFMSELLSCLNEKFGIYIDIINKRIDSLRNDKKDIEAIALEQKYYFSFNNNPVKPSDEKYVSVRKQIAQICKSAGIEPGIYSNDEATEIVRKLQELIIPKFEEQIIKYDRILLHKKIVSSLAANIQKKNIDMKRYLLSNKESLSDEAKERTIINTINLREEAKNQIRDLSYLIDANLSLERSSSNHAENSDVEYLLAFSHWLMLLQDCSDQAHYKLFDAQIKIENDYRVSTKYPNDKSDYANQQNRRIYDSKDYVPQIDNEEYWISQALNAFYNDTKVSLAAIIGLCSNYLALEFHYTFTHESEPDVFEINRDDLISDLESILIDKNQINDYVKALDYLTIDTSKIKTIGDERLPFVPVWEREKRDQRFDVRPIVANENQLIFSPVIIYELATMWKVGLQEFYPPYEINLNDFTSVLKQWKTECETQMETDIEHLCKNAGYITYKNLKLNKINKKHPANLGDYDVVAIDTTKKLVWNLESKFLIKVGSIKEYANHQNSFFISNKKDEKFARRIVYLSANLVEILNALGIDDADHYTMKNFMVTNKVFSSFYKKIDFDILTFSELKSLLSQQ